MSAANLETWRGKRIAITGTHPWHTRSDVESTLRSVCATITTSVNGKTDLLARAANAPESSKTAAARKLGVEICDLYSLVELAQNGRPFPGKTPSPATRQASAQKKNSSAQGARIKRTGLTDVLRAQGLCRGFVGF